MATLRAEWPNEARWYEKIKTDVITTTKKAQAILDELKRSGIHHYSLEVVRANYLHCLRLKYSVPPHRPRRKRTVHFKGESHPERKGKYNKGRRFPAHIRQQYWDADMWYTSDDKQRYENDRTSLKIVTAYREGVKTAKKRAIIPRRKFTYSRPTGNSTIEEGRWRRHVQLVNKKRAELANEQRADEDRRRRQVELIDGVEYQWAPGAISTGSTPPLAPTANPYDALKLPATQQSKSAGRDSPFRTGSHCRLNDEQIRALDISAPPRTSIPPSCPRPNQPVSTSVFNQATPQIPVEEVYNTGAVPFNTATSWRK